MTVVSSDQRPGRDDPDETRSTAPDELPDDGDARWAPHVPDVIRRTTWRFWIFAPALVVLVLLAPALAWKGFSILRTEDVGQEIGVTDDPDAAGFQAIVTPTPVAMLVDIGAQNSLAGVTLITIPTQQGGGDLVFFPVGTLLEVPLRDPPEATLVDIYAEGGLSALEQRVETMLGAGISEVIRVPKGQWAAMVRPVAPLTVDNPVAVETTNLQGQPVSFPQGEIQLSAPQVGPYLQARGEDETDIVRLQRHEAFWTAWLAALDEAGDDAVPGEGTVGLGGYVRSLTGGPRTYMTLPATPVPIPGASIIDSDLFRPNLLEIAGLVPEIIPFPVGVGRLRTRLVMGVEGQTDLLPVAAHSLVVAGAEISVIKNDDEFDEARTVVYFFQREDREQAQRLVEALGVGELVRDTRLSDTVDVVVVLGQDYVDAQSGGAPATTAPGGTGIPTGGGGQSGGVPGAGVTPGQPGGETPG
jgi:hypothetical protein